MTPPSPIAQLGAADDERTGDLADAERSRGLFEHIADAANDRRDTFPGHLLPERCQFLGLFAKYFELLAGVRRPYPGDIGRRLNLRDLKRKIKSRRGVSSRHFNHLDVQGTHIFDRDRIALFNRLR